jgi:hypothetical protein
MKPRAVRGRSATSKVLPRNQLTSELRSRFEHLLFTWHFKNAYRLSLEEMESLVRLRGEARTARSLEYEKENGDGHYEDRKELLGTLLQKLEANGRVDLEAVYSALLWAKQIRYKVASVWKILSRRRRRNEEQELVSRQLREWIPRALRLYDGLPATETECLLFALDVVMKTDPILATGPERRLTRATAGHPPEPWVRRARKRLALAGVRQKELRDQLLVAVGLSRYRN